MKIGSAINQIEINAPAKINLFLEIHGKRHDGFHELETVMATVSLYDCLRFRLRNDDQIRLSIANVHSREFETVEIPSDDRNLIVRALKLLRSNSQAEIDRPLGCDVSLFKRIPAEAGLGGASSNAAAALIAGSNLWELKFSQKQWEAIAAELGSDVPFFMFGGAAVCRGRGEKITPTRALPGLPIVIAKLPKGLVTGQVFKRCEIPDAPRSVAASVASMATGRPDAVAASLFNRLQPVASQMTEQVGILAEAYRKINCPGHQMTGSGTSYFGVFPSFRSARVAVQTLSARLPGATITHVHTLGQNFDIAA